MQPDHGSMLHYLFDQIRIKSLTTPPNLPPLRAGTSNSRLALSRFLFEEPYPAPCKCPSEKNNSTKFGRQLVTPRSPFPMG